MAALALGALGIVYGDIGTSPLYTIKECFHGIHGIEPSTANVFGVLSLIFWSMTMVVSFKYLGFILKADNRGEGGIFALLALLPRERSRIVGVASVSALFGAALLYGDGIITPAISVLSAVEGLEVATEAARPFVIPLVCLILFGLFSVQRWGTHGIGRIFGPVMIVWFLALAALGVASIARHPAILSAINPVHAVEFFGRNHLHGIVVLGSVVLSITGAEALYADLGHFGARPIRLSWFGLAFPALLLNYFGQGAELLFNPALSSNPFYALVPRVLLYPMVALATMATVIASQALISGVFSLTSQAAQLGYLPRVHVVHTSGETMGQIYVPGVNTALMVACIGLVLAFQESSRLAAAYGIAVTANMGITSVLWFLVARKTWGWSLAKTAPLVALFLVFDLSYFGANLLKVLDGGWFPLVVAAGLLTIMLTWRDGRRLLAEQIKGRTLPLDLFIADVGRRKPYRVRGTAVFMASAPKGTPPALLHHIKHNQVLHEQVVLLSIRTSDRPWVPPKEKVEFETKGEGFFRLVADVGFMEQPDVPELLRLGKEKGLNTDPATTSYYLGRETLLTSGREKMSNWRKSLFTFLSRNAQPASNYFNLPAGRVVELGMQVEI